MAATPTLGSQLWGSWTARARAFRRDRRAATTLEFAILAVPFIFWIAGLMMIGVQFVITVWLDNVVQTTGRSLTINPANRTKAYVVSHVCNQMNIVAASSGCSSGTLQVFAMKGSGFGALTAATLTGSTLSPQSFDAGVVGDYVLLQVAYTSPFTLPGGFVPNLTMVASAPYQNNR